MLPNYGLGIDNKSEHKITKFIDLPWGKGLGCTKYRKAWTILNKIPIGPGSWYAPVSYVLEGTNPKSKVPGGGLYIGCTSETVLPQNNSSSSRQSSTAMASSIHKIWGRGICPTKPRNLQYIHSGVSFLGNKMLVSSHLLFFNVFLSWSGIEASHGNDSAHHLWKKKQNSLLRCEHTNRKVQDICNFLHKLNI